MELVGNICFYDKKICDMISMYSTLWVQFIYLLLKSSQLTIYCTSYCRNIFTSTGISEQGMPSSSSPIYENSELSFMSSLLGGLWVDEFF